MTRSKHKLDPNTVTEVTRRISDGLVGLLDGTLASLKDDYFLIDDLEAAEFPYRYLKDVFLSKYVDENTDPAEVRRARAIEKWLGVELRNERTNRRLLETDPYFQGVGHGWQILRRASQIIKSVIGASPPEGLLLRGAFTGGATTSRKRNVAALASKFSGRLDATPDCFKRFKLALGEDGVQGWTFYQPELHSPRLVKGNVLFTVPKTAVIDRVACKEPDINIFCQKAVGDYLRHRLRKRASIDLNDQSVNREMARVASIRGSHATIDLSSASDSLTTSLVMALLPRDWFLLLDDLRCPQTFIDGTSHKNEMFSSMGNGFTFELESMVFWALARATCYLSGTRGRVSVYGDDIIIPTDASRMFLDVLRWTGFKPNVDKTFVRGPFRESCGGHYYRGLDVTPFFLRRPIKDVSDLILFLNQLRAWIIRTSSDWNEEGYLGKNRYVRFWYNLASFVPRSLWGGYSLESRTQLASPGRQQCELLMTTRRWARLETEHQIGLYLARLSELDRRGSSPAPGLSFSRFLTDTGKYRLRRVRFEPAVFGVVKPLFVCEQLLPDTETSP